MTDEEIISAALGISNKILESPDVPSAEIYPLMNKLSAYIAQLRASAVNKDKKEAEGLREVCRGLETVLSTLKYQAKQYQNDLESYRFNKI